MMTEEFALPLLAELWQRTLNWQPNSLQHYLFQQLYQQVLAGNQHLNLTRITEPQEFWEKHLWDSLIGIRPFLTQPDQMAAAQVIDIGTGAGFPGVPVAIACPSWQVTLLDATQKKIAFLHQLQQALQLQNLAPLAGRSEAIGQLPQYRQHYDLALVRAVGPASVCAEYALPLLKLQGLAILYRGQWSEAETQALQLAVEPLGGHVEEVIVTMTPLSQSRRHLLYLRKSAPTPAAFPRSIGLPAKLPL